MKITDIKLQSHDKNRVNVSVDGAYKFSLDVFQVGELGLKVGQEYSDRELAELEQESQFGKLYARTLEYCMVRPRAIKEVRNYLWRKTRSRKVLSQPPKRSATGQASSKPEVREIPGVSEVVAQRVLDRLIEKNYLDDEKFARFWLEHRFVKKGTSVRRLKLELAQKGIARELIEQLVSENVRSDEEELTKIIAKKRYKYGNDPQKFMAYLVRQGFAYDDVKTALGQTEED